MANLNLKFLRGLQSSLPTTGTDGYFYLTTDTHRLYTSVDGKIVPVNEGVVTVANIAALNDITANAGDFFYATEENVLCVYNGQNFIQINAQKTLAELGGVAQSAYDEKMLALEKADSDNADAISGVDTRLQAAEEKLKSVATTEGLGELTDRVTTAEGEIDALQADSHTHTFVDTDVEDAISKKHAHTFVDTDVEDAIAKKHAHTFVESELNKIVAGDVAKWNGVVADHLTSADKTLIEDSIGDVNTALENYKTSNDEALAGVKATADAAAVKTEVESALAGKVAKTDYEADKATFATKTDIEKLAGVSEGANKVEASETNGNIKIDGVETVVYTHPEKHTIAEVDGLQDALDGKQAAGDYSVEGHKHVKADITDFAHTHVASEITDLDSTIKGYDYATKTELGNVDKKFENYKTAEAQKAIDDEQDRRLGVIEGDYLKAADIADFETKENVKKVADDFAAYVESNDAAIANRYTKAEADGKFAIKGADAYDDTALSNRVKAIEDDYLVEADKTELAGLVTAEKERAEGIEGGFERRIKAIEDDYLVEADKTALQDQITANANAITLLTNGASAEEVDGVNDLIKYVKEHGTEVTGMKEDIAENAKAISDHEALAAETYETKTDAGNKLTEAKTYADGLNTAMDTRVKALEDHKDDYIAAVEGAKTEAANQDAVVLSEAQKYTDAAKDAAIADAASKYETIGTAQGIVDDLKLSETYEPIGAEGRAIAAAEGKVNALAGEGNTSTVKKNADDIATLFEMFQWGEF